MRLQYRLRLWASRIELADLQGAKMRMSLSSIGAGALMMIAAAAMTGSVVAEGETNRSNGDIVFTDDFESGLDGWRLLDPKTWKLSSQDGNSTLGITARESEYQPPHRSPLHIALVEKLKPEDFEITFRVRSTRDTGDHRDCCVFFGYQDDRHFYYVHLGAKPDPHSGQIMIVDDAPRLALTENKTPVAWGDGWHKVRLVRRVIEGTIEIYFDDLETPIMAAKNSKFGAGQVGIGSFDDMNEFDDIMIRQLPAK